MQIGESGQLALLKKKSSHMSTNVVQRSLCENKTIHQAYETGEDKHNNSHTGIRYKRKWEEQQQVGRRLSVQAMMTDMIVATISVNDTPNMPYQREYIDGLRYI